MRSRKTTALEDHAWNTNWAWSVLRTKYARGEVNPSPEELRTMGEVERRADEAFADLRRAVDEARRA